MGLTLFNSDL